MSATGSAARPVDAGATLMEMLVVLGLLALATGIVFPNLRRPYETLAAETAGRAVSSDLRNARAEAVRTDRALDFAVSPDGRQYGWGDRRMLLPASVRIAGPAEGIDFAADGSSSGGRLVLSQRGRPRFQVTVDPATGVASFERFVDRAD